MIPAHLSSVWNPANALHAIVIQLFEVLESLGLSRYRTSQCACRFPRVLRSEQGEFRGVEEHVPRGARRIGRVAS